jgi:hypothetical protein
MSMLDDIVFSSALAEARRLISAGYEAEKAAECACHGAWAVYRQRVLARLLADQKSSRRDPG